MKKLSLIFGIFFFFSLFSSSLAFQEGSFQTYDTREAFEASGELGVCSVATDGCSEFTVTDSVIGDPTKACKVSSDFKFQWSCLTQNSEITYMTDGVPESIPSNGLTTDEQYFLDTYLERIGKAKALKVEKILERYTKKISLLPFNKQVSINKKVKDALQSKISALLMTFPQDVAIPKKDYPNYMMLEILKYRLMIFQNELESMDPINYSCDDKKTFLTVYRADYAIDDMSFQVGSDEIHVSDGLFLLPNYIAKREIVTIGEKFVGRDTETNKAVSFYFKNEEVSLYQGIDLKLTCRAVFE